MYSTARSGSHSSGCFSAWSASLALSFCECKNSAFVLLQKQHLYTSKQTSFIHFVLHLGILESSPVMCTKLGLYTQQEGRQHYWELTVGGCWEVTRPRAARRGNLQMSATVVIPTISDPASAHSLRLLSPPLPYHVSPGFLTIAEMFCSNDIMDDDTSGTPAVGAPGAAPPPAPRAAAAPL